MAGGGVTLPPNVTPLLAAEGREVGRWRALSAVISAVPPKARCEPSLVETAPPFFVELCPSAWNFLIGVQHLISKSVST